MQRQPQAIRNSHARCIPRADDSGHTIAHSRADAHDSGHTIPYSRADTDDSGHTIAHSRRRSL